MFKNIDQLPDIPSRPLLIRLFTTFLLPFISVWFITWFKLHNLAYFQGTPYLLYIFPVVVSSAYGGLAAGLLATFICTFAIDYYFLPPLYSIDYSLATVIQKLVFSIQGIIITLLISSINYSRIQEYRQRQWFQTTLSSIGDAVIATDKLGKIIFINDVAKKITGWTGESAQYQLLNRVFKIINEKSRKRLDSIIDQVLQQKKPVELSNHTILISKNRREIAIEDSAAPIFDSSGNISGIVLVFHDISEKNKLLKQLKITEERFSLALKNTDIVIWNQDKNLKYTWLYPEDNQILPQSILGKMDNQLNLYPSPARQIITRLKRGVLRTQKPAREVINISFTNIPVYYEFSFFPLLDEHRKLLGLTGTLHDVTQQKLLENKKDEFISIASHELRTPLTIIKGYLQLLERNLKGSDYSAVKPYLTKTKSHFERLNDLVNNLLDVSKIQSGKLQLNINGFDIDTLIDRSLENMQMLSSTHKIIKANTLHLSYAGDILRLEQVLNNLISNAIKYSPKADRIVVGSRQEKDRLVVFVQDFGIGIHSRYKDKMFTQFYRIEDTDTKFSGLGIGLYISQEIVYRHGGKLWFDSVPGQGSIFYFSLPLKT